MSISKDTFQHPAISCKHQLDLSNIQKLAKDISSRLLLNIEIHYHSSSLLSNETISIDGISKKVFLIERYRSIIPKIKLELVQKEFRLIVYEDFIEISLEITIDYFHLLQLNKENQLIKIEPFKTIFNQLKTLKINEVYFCVFEEFKIEENKNYCWKNVNSAINKCSNNFILEI
jgi:hypothetical protein